MAACPGGYYRDNNATCQPNPIGCMVAAVVNNNVTCTTPEPGFVISDSQQLKCSQILWFCDQCQIQTQSGNPVDVCTKCQANALLMPNGTCSLTCPESNYIDSTGLCKPNPANCKFVDPATGTCTQAIDGFHLVDGLPTRCSDSIPSCQSCSSQIQGQDRVVTCHKCDSAFLLQSNACSRVCEENEMADGNVRCTNRPQNCLGFHPSRVCLEPVPGFYLQNSSVITCSAAVSQCERCSAIKPRELNFTVRCTKCAGSRKFNTLSNSCVTECPTRTYVSILDECREIPVGCKTMDPYGTCLEADITCPVGQHVNSSSSGCRNNDPGCQT